MNKVPSKHILKVVFLPQTEVYEGNPYWEQLHAHLEMHGVEFVQTDDKLYLQWRWLLRNRRLVDVIHFHFIQHNYAINEKQASIKLLMKFIGKLVWAKLLGYRLVWTLHNLYPHEPLLPEYVERAAYLFMSQISDAIVVHCENAREALAREFYRRRSVYTIFHPNYIGAYDNTISREEARTKLGLKKQHRVVLFLGGIRMYKGIDELIQAFTMLHGEELRLVIAGKPKHNMSEEDVQKMVQGDSRILLALQFIPDDDLQIYFNAADVVVLPYANVLSSGSALLAMSFGRPVIAPSIGCLTEIVIDSAGILYGPEETNGLYSALEKAMSQDLKAMGENARSWATQFTWDGMAKKTLDVYHS